MSRGNVVRGRWKNATLAVLVFAGIGGASLGAATGATPRPLVGGAHRVTATIRIDSDDTFAPPPKNASPKLSADAAWRRYSRAHGHPQKRPRAGNKIWIGLFTSGHETYRKLAYGYEWKHPIGCVTTLPTPHPKKCRDWTFVAANTGNGLGSRQQVLKTK